MFVEGVLYHMTQPLVVWRVLGAYILLKMRGEVVPKPSCRALVEAMKCLYDQGAQAGKCCKQQALPRLSKSQEQRRRCPEKLPSRTVYLWRVHGVLSGQEKGHKQKNLSGDCLDEGGGSPDRVARGHMFMCCVQNPRNINIFVWALDREDR